MSAPLLAPPVPRGLCGKQAPEGGSCTFIKGHDQYALTGGTHSWAVKS